MTLAQDSHMNRPVHFDVNTSVGYYPWEDSTFGATRSYHLNSMANVGNPFTQIMDPAFDSRSEMTVESQDEKDDTLEQRNRESDMETGAAEQVGSHTMRAEGDEDSEDSDSMSDDSKKNFALLVIGGFVAVGVLYYAASSA
tara:strand:+ start:130 stop:552 length:423 start_codon:yes stop_codon:yes gene_type:complete